ncbi:MAG TPA: DUF2142 domain-containing protein [Pseudomonadales bacterium]|nr:DUF2142 domain-containing protein [Pseudomonadales bacterium]
MQTGEDTRPPAAFSESREKTVVLLLCVVAALHVLLFSAAFPFFNNVDEGIHFDLIVKYSEGHVPQGKELVSPESASWLAQMNSHAYLGMPGQFPNGQLPPPPWTLPAGAQQRVLAERSASWRAQQNYEVSQAPLYYALAGFWWDVGGWLGLADGRLLYWLRFLNALMMVAAVWFAYAAARVVFFDNIFVRFGVPALLAFMPQTAFYSLGNDVLSLACFGATFYFLLKWLHNPGAAVGGLTGLGFAATYLAKISNLPLLLIVLIVVVMKTSQRSEKVYRRAATEAMVGFLCCAIPPIACWMVWCQINFGDLTGSGVKTDFLGWTIKPFSQWWQHPIFLPAGLWTYLSGQLGTLWQGEFWWHHQPMALPWTGVIYTVVSLVLIGAAAPALFRRFSTDPAQRNALRISLACFLAMLGFFAVLSIAYDFHNCPYPSRDYPYFTSGRLLLGAAIPFLLLIVYGLDRLLNRLGNIAKFAVLAIMIGAMLWVEIITDMPVFSNDYNWFHLP